MARAQGRRRDSGWKNEQRPGKPPPPLPQTVAARPGVPLVARPTSTGNLAVPANWPAGVAYLTTPVYHGIQPWQRKLLQSSGGGGNAAPLPEIPPILRFGPSTLVEIRRITDAAHPACGQHGLFAARALAAGAFVVPYLGVYHRGHVAVSRGGGHHTNAQAKDESDYDLWLDRDADVAVDAARAGNEARFVNDYRGTGRPRPNAEFRLVWDPRRGERAMAVFVLPASHHRRRQHLPLPGGLQEAASSKRGGIAKGEEILVSYGKGFWDMRQKELDLVRRSSEETKTQIVDTTAAERGGNQDDGQQ